MHTICTYYFASISVPYTMLSNLNAFNRSGHFRQCTASHIWKVSILFHLPYLLIYSQLYNRIQPPLPPLYVMAANTKGVKTIRQAIQPKQVMKFFKSRSLNLRFVFMTPSDSNVPFLCSATTRIPSGFLAIYVGCEQKRFLIPT